MYAKKRIDQAAQVSLL